MRRQLPKRHHPSSVPPLPRPPLRSSNRRLPLLKRLVLQLFSSLRAVYLDNQNQIPLPMFSGGNLNQRLDQQSSPLRRLVLYLVRKQQQARPVPPLSHLLQDQDRCLWEVFLPRNLLHPHLRCRVLHRCSGRKLRRRPLPLKERSPLADCSHRSRQRLQLRLPLQAVLPSEALPRSRRLPPRHLPGSLSWRRAADRPIE